MLCLIFTTIRLYTYERLGQRVIYMILKHLKNDDLLTEFIESTDGAYSEHFLAYLLPISINILWISFICFSFELKLFSILIIVSISFVGFIALWIWLKYHHLPNNPSKSKNNNVNK